MTVLGTTLTRRQTVIGGAIVLAVVLAVVLIVSLAFAGGDDKTKAVAPAATQGQGSGATTVTAAPTPTPTPAPTQPTPSPTPSKAATSPSAGNGGAVTLPSGWSLYRDPTGFSVPIPTGASIVRRGTEVYFSKDNRLLIVDQTDQPKPDPVADWKNQEAARRGRIYHNYQRIRLVPVKFWTKAADWEFTYTTDAGNPQHAVKRGVITGPKQAYGISWYTSPDDWAGSQQYLQLIYQGFQPKK